MAKKDNKQSQGVSTPLKDDIYKGVTRRHDIGDAYETHNKSPSKTDGMTLPYSQADHKHWGRR